MWFVAFTQTKFSWFHHTKYSHHMWFKAVEMPTFNSDVYVTIMGWTSLGLHLEWKLLSQFLL